MLHAGVLANHANITGPLPDGIARCVSDRFAFSGNLTVTDSHAQGAFNCSALATLLKNAQRVFINSFSPPLPDRAARYPLGKATCSYIDTAAQPYYRVAFNIHFRCLFDRYQRLNIEANGTSYLGPAVAPFTGTSLMDGRAKLLYRGSPTT
jgi:hypothetical protein